MLFNGSSIGEKGSMSQLRNAFGHRHVTTDVMNSFNRCDNFTRLIVESHIIYLAWDVCSMDDIKCPWQIYPKRNSWPEDVISGINMSPDSRYHLAGAVAQRHQWCTRGRNRCNEGRMVHVSQWWYVQTAYNAISEKNKRPLCCCLIIHFDMSLIWCSIEEIQHFESYVTLIWPWKVIQGQPFFLR